MHILLGVPSQLIADYDTDFFRPLENAHIPDGAGGLLKVSDTMGSEGSNLLSDWEFFQELQLILWPTRSHAELRRQRC